MGCSVVYFGGKFQAEKQQMSVIGRLLNYVFYPRDSPSRLSSAPSSGLIVQATLSYLARLRSHLSREITGRTIAPMAMANSKARPSSGAEPKICCSCGR